MKPTTTIVAIVSGALQESCLRRGGSLCIQVGKQVDQWHCFAEQSNIGMCKILVKGHAEKYQDKVHDSVGACQRPSSNIGKLPIHII